MKKLKLPVTDKDAGQDRWLSMNDYIKFVNFNLRCFGKRKISKRDEIAMHVNAPFLIK